MIYNVENVIDSSFEAELKYSIPELPPYVSRQTNSWSICHEEFKKARKQSNPNYDLLALHLGFYLASWGMYRGSSFLKALDYRIHYPAVKMMLEKQYDVLFEIDPLGNKDDYKKGNKDDYKKKLFDKETGIYVRLNKYYGKAHAAWVAWKKENDKANPKDEITTDTLITKILMGVYACIPAYDINFKKGIDFFGGCTTLKPDGKAILNNDENETKSSLLYILQNETLREELKGYAGKKNLPFMKVVDMFFFGLGAAWYKEVDIDTKKKIKEEKANGEVSKERKKLEKKSKKERIKNTANDLSCLKISNVGIYRKGRVILPFLSYRTKKSSHFFQKSFFSCFIFGKKCGIINC